MINEHRNLADLRNAIAQHNWYECEEIIKKFVENLTPSEAVQLSAKQVSLFLPLFEQYHPHITDPHIILDALIIGDPINKNATFPGLLNSYPSPGTNEFMNALELVNAAVQEQHEPLSCYIKAGRAIVNAIGSRRLEYWARKFPEDWELTRRSALGEENLPTLQSAYLRESEVEQYTEDMWLALAEEVERLLTT